MIASSATGVGTLGKALSHRRRPLAEPGGEDLVERRTGIEEQDGLRCVGERETLHGHTLVGSGGEAHAVAQLHAVIAWCSLLRLLQEPHILSRFIGHERDVAAAAAATHTGEAVDAEA